MKNRKNNKKGFTIVELVIVIGVIGILSAILIPTFANLTNEANKARAVAEVQGAYSLYIQDAVDEHVGDYASMTSDEKVAALSLVQLAQDKVAIKRGDLWYLYSSNGGWAVKDYGEDPVPTVELGAGYNGCHVYVK